MTTSSVGTVIAGIMDIVGAVTGIRSAPDEVPERAAPGLCAIAYPGAGEFVIGDPQGEMKGLHTVVLEILAPRKGLLRAVLKTLYPFGVSIPLALAADTTFGGAAHTFGAITYIFGNSPVYGEGWLGWIFTISGIKTNDTY